ncbi:microcystin degradation protein MlrC [Maritalea mobilis]|uniref:Microcystin degradation protein MlrC n=1 Tax=Maritalea mobilis TaxID=483324 RepID=A0A4R6VP99_9HYPH|nr:M81 family metallopeptidase [Maritalea mobilis]TDQ64050.1 microcystin degradation protein MlrC [Maritalea mobilis]
MRIAVAGLHTECSTYTSVEQTKENFNIMLGADVLKHELFKFLDHEGVDIAPLFYARATPGGPVAAKTYDEFKAQTLAALDAALAEGPLDGVYLAMHGAVHVTGMEDAEGDFLEAIRQRVGDEVIISSSYDLHGNVTQKVIDQLDIFTAFRHAPHIDTYETFERAFLYLVDALKTGKRPKVCWAPIPVLLPGEKTSTVDEPAKSLYAQLWDIDKRKGVLDASLMVGYVWADVARGTAAAVVCGYDDAAIKKAAEDIAQSYFDAREDFAFGVPAAPLAETLDAASKIETGPIVICDSGDNPGGGGVGDRVDVLKEAISRELKDLLVIGICAPKAVAKAFEADLDAKVHMSIGAELDTLNSPTIEGDATILRRAELANGQRLALVEIGGVRAVLNEKRQTFHEPSDVAALGLDVAEEKMIAIKCGYISADMSKIANPNLMALTDGAVNQDIERLVNKHRQSPTFPFQKDFSYTPKAIMSE